MRKARLSINGENHELEAHEDMPLLWAIRDFLGLKGTKYGCGQGLCGACTVLVDGEPTRSCSYFLTDAEGVEVITIEGLKGPLVEKLKSAWVAEQVPQCGYCNSGQLIAAATLLTENSSPSSDDIEDALSGHICRCGTYGRIKNAINRVVGK